LIDRVERCDPDRNAELLLSGGVDSSTVLFAMLESGRKPRCLTFHIDGLYSNDLKVSKAMCKTFGLEHEIITLPRETAVIYAECERTIGMIDWTRIPKIRKTHVECLRPFLYLLPAMKTNRVLTGLGADTFYIHSRKLNYARSVWGEDYTWCVRRSYAADPNFSASQMPVFAKKHFNIDLIDIYDDPFMAAWFWQFNTFAPDTPVEKWASVIAFKDYWGRAKWYRKADRFNVGSGLRDSHDTMLDDGKINTQHSDGVIALYNRIAKRLKVEVGTNLPNRSSAGDLIKPDGAIYGVPYDFSELYSRYDAL
jgi:asparagine synthetase B (glutamine-hydrolysing)